MKQPHPLDDTPALDGLDKLGEEIFRLRQGVELLQTIYLNWGHDEDAVLAAIGKAEDYFATEDDPE